MSEIPNPMKCKGGPGNTCWELMCTPCSEELNRLRAENERLRDDNETMARALNALDGVARLIVDDAVELRGDWSDFDGRSNLHAITRHLDTATGALDAAAAAVTRALGKKP